MSKETENSLKAELNKHINSKLFQKFLSKEAGKIPEISPIKQPQKSSIKVSPKKVRNENTEANEEERHKSAPRTLNKSVSQKGPLKNLGC